MPGGEAAVGMGGSDQGGHLKAKIGQKIDASCVAHRLAACLLLIAGLALAGCVGGLAGGGAQPFAKNPGALASPQAATESWPQITVDSFSGLPEGRDEAFLQALAAETYRRQIALVNLPPGKGIYGLKGSVNARNIDGRIAVAWTWNVQGWTENRNTSLNGQEFIARPRGAPLVAATDDPWSKVDEFMLRRVAIHMAELLSGFFNSQGYVTQTAGLPPPVETFVRAGPGAAKDIDLSMLGPNELAMRRERGEITDEQLIELGLDMAQAQGVPGNAGVAPDGVPPQGPSSPGANSQAAAQKSDGPAIRSVAVASVSGAPGDGNRSLAASLRKFLRKSGWPVKEQAEKDSLTIVGTVGVAPPTGGVQQVSLEWTIKDPAGKVLGSMKQANQVPAGSLDKAWGLTADYAAEAAGMGIFDLVDKLR